MLYEFFGKCFIEKAVFCNYVTKCVQVYQTIDCDLTKQPRYHIANSVEVPTLGLQFFIEVEIIP